MKTVPVMILTAVLLGLGLFGIGVWAADHMDAPAVTAEPAADINDIFTWMSADGANLNLVMTVFPSARLYAGGGTSVYVGLYAAYQAL
jgi:hypothetical protein